MARHALDDQAVKRCHGRVELRTAGGDGLERVQGFGWAPACSSITSHTQQLLALNQFIMQKIIGLTWICNENKKKFNKNNTNRSRISNNNNVQILGAFLWKDYVLP